MTRGPSTGRLDRAEPLANPTRVSKGDVMRVLRVSLVGTVILVLLGGTGSVALAQEDVDTVKVTPFTGTRLSAVEGAIDEEWWGADGSLHLRGGRATEMIEWSDPRLPSEVHAVQNLVASGSSATVFGTTLSEAPEGYWTGEFTVVCDADGDCHAMNHMIGHEAYEGLFAVARGFWADGPGSDWVFDGLIFESEMPPMPEALEPPAE